MGDYRIVFLRCVVSVRVSQGFALFCRFGLVYHIARMTLLHSIVGIFLSVCDIDHKLVLERVGTYWVEAVQLNEFGGRVYINSKHTNLSVREEPSYLPSIYGVNVQMIRSGGLDYSAQAPSRAGIPLQPWKHHG